MPQIIMDTVSASPNPPSAGKVTFFFKSDFTMWKRLPDGTEVSMDSGGGGDVTQAELDAAVALRVAKAGDTMSGPLAFLEGTSAASLDIVPDTINGGNSFLISSPDGMRISAPHLVIDSANPHFTMPGAVTGAVLVVAGVNSGGEVSLGYQAPISPSYQVSDTHNANVVIKPAGATTIPSTAVTLGLSVTPTQEIPFGTGTGFFDVFIQNSTAHSGTVEFGIAFNTSPIWASMKFLIPANFAQRISTSYPIVNGIPTGTTIELIARVTEQSNAGFEANMLASAGSLANFRISSIAPYQMAGNGPAFAASGMTQEFTVNTSTKVNATTEIFDTNNCYDAPNSRFTPNVPGYYQCNLALNNQVALDTFGIYGYITKNSNIVAQGGSTGNASAFAFASPSCLVYMNGTTDYIEAGATLTGPTGTGNAACNHFSAALVRAA